MSELHEHLEHEPYLNAVADALDIEVHDVVAHPDDPRDGYLAIGYEHATRVGCHADDLFVLGWSEEKGWDCGIERDGHGRVQYLYEPAPPLPVLAEPSQVAGWCRQMLNDGIEAHARMASGRRYRQHEDGDAAFESALAGYATASA